MTDRRSGRRNRVLLAGKIAYGAGFSIDCTVRDISETGACIVLPKHQAAPEDLHLIVVRDGVAHKAHTAWIAYPQVGLRFDASHELSNDVPAHLRPLRALWQGLAR